MLLMSQFWTMVDRGDNNIGPVTYFLDHVMKLLKIVNLFC